MHRVFLTFFCLGNVFFGSSAYTPAKHGGENAVDYRYNAGAALKVQLPCNLGRGTYGAGTWSVKNLRPTNIDCLCKLKNSQPGSEDNDSFQYFLQVSRLSSDAVKCEQQTDDDGANAKLGSLEIPCSLGTSDYYIGYWKKQDLSSSTVQCLCELGSTKIGSLLLSPYDLWVRATGIKLWDPKCNEENEENEEGNSTPAPADEEDSTPVTLYTYDLSYNLTYTQKYDIESYLSTGKYYFDDSDLWINFIDGINENNQPKLGYAVVKANINDQKWELRDFADLSFCQEYPENSWQWNAQRILQRLIFGEVKGCSIEPDTNVTLQRNPSFSITIDEKISCGEHSLEVVLQSPDGEDAVGLYWIYNVAPGTDCVDYSIEEEREKKNIKKAFITTPIQKIKREFSTGLESQEDPCLITNNKAKDNEENWYAFPKGLDNNSGVIFKTSTRYDSNFPLWNLKDSGVKGPCDEIDEYSQDNIFLHMFKYFVLQGNDCPIEKGTNYTIPVEYLDTELNTYYLLPCGKNWIYLFLHPSEDSNFSLIFMGSWFVSNTTQCIDYSTYGL